MMFVSFNIAVKWVSYGNDGTPAKFAGLGVHLGNMNGMEYFTVPLSSVLTRAMLVLIRI